MNEPTIDYSVDKKPYQWSLVASAGMGFMLATTILMLPYWPIRLTIVTAFGTLLIGAALIILNNLTVAQVLKVRTLAASTNKHGKKHEKSEA